MNRYKKQKQSFYLMLIILLILGVGIGYALLTETLTISNSAMLAEMKWDVGFSNVEDNGSTIPVDTEISNNGKTMTVLCDFGSNTEQQTCTIKATIKNDSTFDIGLKNDPTISYDDTYIHTVTFKWADHPTYENHTVLKDNFIKKGESEEVILTIKTKFIKKEMLPISNTTIPITITLNFVEWKNGELPTVANVMIPARHLEEVCSYWEENGETFGDCWEEYRYSAFWEYAERIKNIYIENELSEPQTYAYKYDVSEAQNGSVLAYLVTNADNSSYFDLYLQADGMIYANTDASYYFCDMFYLESINNLEGLDTSAVTNMSYMFRTAGYNSSNFDLDFSSFDTSNVTDMSYIFYYTGFNSSTFALDVSKMDTSSVTDMSYMFHGIGYNSTNVIFDLSNFDTSNVRNMSGMFHSVGQNSTNLSIDFNSFDTSNVIYMNSMFELAGYNSTNVTLDLSNFDTSKVIRMDRMFMNTGYKCTNLTIDLSSFDTSNVTDMTRMFESAGTYATSFVFDVSGFDTSNVTSMYRMFYYAGKNSTNITLDVSGWNTSNVTSMAQLFDSVGYSNPNFTLDVSKWDTTNVINMEAMFRYAGYNSIKMNTSITIRNPELANYSSRTKEVFKNFCVKSGTKMVVNYTSETSSLVDTMVATKTSGANVVKGKLVS